MNTFYTSLTRIIYLSEYIRVKICIGRKKKAVAIIVIIVTRICCSNWINYIHIFICLNVYNFFFHSTTFGHEHNKQQLYYTWSKIFIMFFDEFWKLLTAFQQYIYAATAQVVHSIYAFYDWIYFSLSVCVF